MATLTMPRQRAKVDKKSEQKKEDAHKDTIPNIMDLEQIPEVNSILPNSQSPFRIKQNSNDILLSKLPVLPSQCVGKFGELCEEHHREKRLYCQAERKFFCEMCLDQHSTFIRVGYMEDWIVKNHIIEKKKALNNNIKNAENMLRDKYSRIKKIIEEAYIEANKDLTSLSHEDVRLNREQTEMEIEMKSWGLQPMQYADIYSQESNAEISTHVFAADRLFQDSEKKVNSYKEKLNNGDNEMFEKMKAIILMDKQ